MLGIEVPADPRPMAATRIALGAYLLAYLGSMLPDVPLLFSDQGVYAPYLVPDMAPPVGVAWGLFALMLAAASALLVGYRARLAVLVLLPLYLHHYFLQLAIKQSSFERLLIVALFLFALDGGDGAYALRPTPPRDRFVPRMIMLQLVLLYLGAGLWKVVGPHWQDGTVLREAYQGMFATKLAFALARLPIPDVAWSLLARGVAYGEILLAALLCWPRTRPVGIALGTLFHLLNVVLLYIPEFTLCIALYPLFLSAHAYDRLDRLGQRATLRPRASAS